MIIRNTPANLALVGKMEELVNSYPGYRAFIDTDWNCGKDIRFEFSVVSGVGIPFTVGSWMVGNRVEVKVRMILTDCKTDRLRDWSTWFWELDKMVRDVNSRIPDWKKEEVA